MLHGFADIGDVEIATLCDVDPRVLGRRAEEIARGDDEVAVVDVAGLRAAGALSDTVAALIDEIDEVLEENADDKR